ncbi:hypothetical protein RQN30_05495 [Arcanobacterium hippocoleae]
MESKDTPQWVSQSFLRSMLNAGAAASRENIIACCDDLIRAWCAPGRFEHGFQHLLDMLSRVDSLAPETPNADLVRIATWFHGIVFSTSDINVYTRNGGEDEHASARMAEEKMTLLGLPRESIQAVKKLIIGLKKRGIDRKTAEIIPPLTETHLSSDTHNMTISETGVFEAIDMDQHALCDAHLGALAVEPQRYRKYSLRIREEYAHIPLTHFLAARIKIVQRLLARKKLYMSPLASSWENIARQNLTAELDQLTAELVQVRESGNIQIAAAVSSTNHQNRNNGESVPESAVPNSAASGSIASGKSGITSAAPALFTAERDIANLTPDSLKDAAETGTTRTNPAVPNNSDSEKPLSVSSEYETVQCINGNTLVRKAVQAPLSSLEVIDEDFDPKRSPKIIKPKFSSGTPADSAEPAKHGIEAEPDF